MQLFRLRRALAGLLALTLLSPFAPVGAQDDVAARIGTDQDVLRRPDEEVAGRQIPFRITDPELGEIDLVSRAPRPKTFTFSTDQNLLYTTNAFLAPDPERDTFFWNGRLAGSYVPYSTVNFTPRINFEQNFFRYDEFGVLDFDSQSLQFDMKYDFRRDDSWYANLSYTGARLYSPDDNVGEFYRYGLLAASVTNVRQLGGMPLYLSSSLGSNWRHGDPSDFDRATVYLNFILLYKPMETLQFAAFARPEMQFYLRDPNDDSRRDFNFNAGIGATWTPIEYFSMGVAGSFTGNASSAARQDYKVFLPGVVASGHVSF
ncbi:MAG: hypothetical protein ABI946_04640 [Chthoniobacterales bacterium]